MRIDKFLKNSRIIKRRTIAKEACDQGRVSINGSVAKPGSEVKEGDILEISLGSGVIKARILATPDHVTKEGAENLYEILKSS